MLLSVVSNFFFNQLIIFDQITDRTMSRVSAGSVAEKSTLIGSDVMRLGLVNHYNKHEPTVHLPFADLPPGSSTKILGSYVQTYNYALLDGRRIIPTTRARARSAESGLIQIQFKGEAYVGEVRVIFQHDQMGIPGSKDALLAYIKWLKPSNLTPLNNNAFVWNDLSVLRADTCCRPDFVCSPELGVDTWEFNKYAHPTDPDCDCPPFVIPLSDIQCQVSRGLIKFTKPPIWITTTMDRVRSSNSFGAGAKSVISTRLRFQLTEWAMQ
jgi:hypothetical protein